MPSESVAGSRPEDQPEGRLEGPGGGPEIALDRPAKEADELDQDRLVEAQRPAQRLDRGGWRVEGQQGPRRVAGQEDQGEDDERDAEDHDRVGQESADEEPDHVGDSVAAGVGSPVGRSGHPNPDDRSRHGHLSDHDQAGPWPGANRGSVAVLKHAPGTPRRALISVRGKKR